MSLLHGGGVRLSRNNKQRNASPEVSEDQDDDARRNGIVIATTAKPCLCCISFPLSSLVFPPDLDPSVEYPGQQVQNLPILNTILFLTIRRTKAPF